MAGDNVIRTGIAGFDDLLFGGIPRTNVILVEGTTGSGKTLLGVEFIYRGITQFDEPGIIVVFEVSPDKLIRDAATLGWDLEALQAQKKLQIVFTSPQVLDQELRSADSLLLETAAEMGAQLSLSMASACCARLQLRAMRWSRALTARSCNNSSKL